MRSLEHRNKALQPLTEEVEQIQSSFRSRIATYRIQAMRQHINLKDFLGDVIPKASDLLDQLRSQHTALKINLELFGLYYLESRESYDVKSFATRNTIIHAGVSTQEVFQELGEVLDRKSQEFAAEKDSGMLKNFKIKSNLILKF